MVAELPWNSKTGTLRRDLAEGMMNPACRHALEAALQLKRKHGGHITVISMGPPMAEEVLREAIALGADRGLLLTDRRMAGADTFMTSGILAQAIEKECPDYHLILCGCHTSDSETAQVGPQLGDALDIPSVARVDVLDLHDKTVRMERIADGFLEVLEMDLPGLVTVSTEHYAPRYVELAGLIDAFDQKDIALLGVDDLGLDPDMSALKESPTRILDVYSPTLEKKNVVLTGTARKVVDQLLETYGDKISGAIEKDLEPLI